MIRFALFLLCVAGAFAAATFYPLGDKPLAGHLGDIYRSAVVQEKLQAIDSAVGQDLHRFEHSAGGISSLWKKESPRLAPKTHASKEPIATHPNPVSASAAPSDAPHVTRVNPPHEPARDQVNDDDRKGLDHLLSEKLHKH